MRLKLQLRLPLSLVGIITASLIAVTGGFSPVNGQSSSPIRVTYNRGSVVLTNVSSKPIAAIEGTFSYEVVSGVVATPSWRHKFPGALFPGRRYFQPGEARTLPPVAPLHDFSQTITYNNVTITGVVFADGAVWGTTGESLRRTTLGEAGATSLMLGEVLRIFSNLSPERIEQLLNDAGPVIEGQQRGRWLHRVLQKELLDESGHLRPDALDRLRQMIAHLENMIDN